MGQGYVGLPLAHAAVEAGHQVVGLDLNHGRVTLLNQGRSVVDDISDNQVSWMLDKGYRASSSPREYSSAEVVVICVPTPLSRGLQPDLSAVQNAVASIAAHIQTGALIVLESTTFPGTTATIVAPAFTKSGFTIGEDLYLAFSPERIDPGNQKFGIRNTPKVVGADDHVSLQMASSFYASFVEQVVTVSGSAEAELTKLLENTYRHINIGLVNELAVVCHELGIDVWEVIRAAATKPFGFQAFYPGPGVGGHCIPIDPNYLNSRVRQQLGHPFRFVELAEEINSSMPSYIVARAQGLLNARHKSLNGSRILLLGVTYKSGISDTRESPAARIAQLLEGSGAEIQFYDPLVEVWKMDDGKKYSRVPELFAANSESDLTILLQEMPSISLVRLAEGAVEFFDTRGIISPKSLVRRL